MKMFLEQLGEHKISRSESELYRHSRDESSHPFVEPDFVVFPENVEDVVKVFNLQMKKILRLLHLVLAPV